MLEPKLKRWFTEFREIAGCADVPDTLWGFLVRRMRDDGELAEQENSIRLYDGRRVNVTGCHQSNEGFVVHWESPGGMGFQLLRDDERDFHPEDRPKLAAIVDRLEGTDTNVPVPEFETS